MPDRLLIPTLASMSIWIPSQINYGATMMETLDIEQLRQLIGRHVIHQGIPCLVVELLEHEPALVLEATGPREGIQDNLYGDPHRRVAEVFTIPLFEAPDNERLNPDLLALGLIRE